LKIKVLTKGYNAMMIKTRGVGVFLGKGIYMENTSRICIFG